MWMWKCISSMDCERNWYLLFLWKKMENGWDWKWIKEVLFILRKKMLCFWDFRRTLFVSCLLYPSGLIAFLAVLPLSSNCWTAPSFLLDQVFFLMTFFYIFVIYLFFCPPPLWSLQYFSSYCHYFVIYHSSWHCSIKVSVRENLKKYM